MLKQSGFVWERNAGNRLTKKSQYAKITQEIAESQFRDTDM